MNCAQARFALYAYLDREMTPAEEEQLKRHLVICAPCAQRARSARGLARLLRSRLDRPAAPDRLRLRIHNGTHPASTPTKAAVFGLSAAVLLLIVPLVADGVPDRRPAQAPPVRAGEVVSKHMTGTLVCLDCEARQESGLCQAHGTGPAHETVFCSDDGEVWRLLPSPSRYSQAALGQTLTVDGVAFPQSGFLRASRAGY